MSMIWSECGFEESVTPTQKPCIGNPTETFFFSLDAPEFSTAESIAYIACSYVTYSSADFDFDAQHS